MVEPPAETGVRGGSAAECFERPLAALAQASHHAPNRPELFDAFTDAVASALQGQKVGSRVLLVIPPADGYGEQGNEQAGIKGTDTLFFVVDILGAS